MDCWRGAKRRTLWTLSPYTKPRAQAGSLFRWKPTLEVTAVRRRWLNFERRNHRPRWEPSFAVWILLSSDDVCHLTGSRQFDRRQNVAGNHLQSASHSRLCRVAALLRRVHPAAAQVDGTGRSATRHCYSAQLPLLRARLYPSRRRRPESARRWLRHVRRLLGPGNWGARHPCPSHVTNTPALLPFRLRLHSRGVGRPHPGLLPRLPVTPSPACA